MALKESALITMTYAQTMLDFEPSTQTAKYEEYINIATSMVESYTGRKLKVDDYTEDYDGNCTDTILLNQYPVNSVTSVHVDPDRTFGTDTEVTDFVSYENGKLVFPDQLIESNPQSVRVVYNAGYAEADMPDDIKLAMIEIVSFVSKRIEAGASRIGVKAINSPDGLNTGYELSLPLNIRNILDKYADARVG
jgi:hypothetical protein